MEKGKFYFDSERFQDNIVKEIKTISEEMEEIYIKAHNVLDKELKDSDTWKGKQKNEFVAFVDLTTQFHKDLSVSEISPINKFLKTIENIVEAVEDYPSESKSYKRLEKQ